MGKTRGSTYHKCLWNKQFIESRKRIKTLNKYPTSTKTILKNFNDISRKTKTTLKKERKKKRAGNIQSLSPKSGRITTERLRLAGFPANTNDVRARDTSTWHWPLCSKSSEKRWVLACCNWKTQNIFFFLSFLFLFLDILRLLSLLISYFFVIRRGGSSLSFVYLEGSLFILVFKRSHVRSAWGIERWNI